MRVCVACGLQAGGWAGVGAGAESAATYGRWGTACGIVGWGWRGRMVGRSVRCGCQGLTWGAVGMPAPEGTVTH